MIAVVALANVESFDTSAVVHDGQVIARVVLTERAPGNSVFMFEVLTAEEAEKLVDAAVALRAEFEAAHAALSQTLEQP